MLALLKLNKVSPMSCTASPPVGANTGVGSLRSRRYKCKSSSMRVKKPLVVNIRNTLKRIEMVNTLVQFGQVIVSIVIIL